MSALRTVQALSLKNPPFLTILCMEIQVVLGFNNLHNSASKFGKADIRALSNALETAIGWRKDQVILGEWSISSFFELLANRRKTDQQEAAL